MNRKFFNNIDYENYKDQVKNNHCKLTRSKNF